MEFSDNLHDYHQMLGSDSTTSDPVFYLEMEENSVKVKDESRNRKLSVSINKPDWTAFMMDSESAETSVKFTDQLLDTPEILRQCVDWQLHSTSQENKAVPSTISNFSVTYPNTDAEADSQITAIKQELEDYAQSTSTILHTEALYVTTSPEFDVDGSSRTADGSVSPSYSETHSSMAADDEGDDDYRPPTLSNQGCGRRGRPSNSSSRSAHKRKSTEVPKGSDEYKQKRARNNIAVRKSRDKAKQHHSEIEEHNQALENENKDLKVKNENLTNEVSVLRKLITDIGRPLPEDLGYDLKQFCS